MHLAFTRLAFSLISISLVSFGILAEVTQTTGFSEFQFDKAALLELGKVTSIEQMQTMLRERFGVHSVEVPRDSKQGTKIYGSDAWLYFHHPSFQRFEGAHIAAFAPAELPDAAIPKLMRVRSYIERPHGSTDLILFRSDPRRFVLLHEFMHHLIKEQARNAAGLDRANWAVQKFGALYRIDQLFNNAGGITEVELLETLGLNTTLSENQIKEELAINMTLLRHQSELGLDLVSEQSLLTSLKRDIETYIGDAEKLIDGYFHHYDTANLIRLERGLNDARKKMKDLRARLSLQVEAFIKENPEWNLLTKINERGVYLFDSQTDSTDSRERLGLAPEVAIDSELLKDTFRFWSFRFHPDRNAKGAEKFKQIQSAKDDLAEWLTNPQAAAMKRLLQVQEELLRKMHEQQAEQARRAKNFNSHLARFGVRFATMCAAGAAYCLFDTNLPWNENFKNFDMEFFWGHFVMTALTATFTTTTDKELDSNFIKDPVKSGIKSGVIRAVGVATCWEILKVFAR